MFTSISSCVLLLICMLQLTLSCHPHGGGGRPKPKPPAEYGDSKVVLHKLGIMKKQIDLYEGDKFYIHVTLRSSAQHEYVDISRLIVTQSVQNQGEISFQLDRVYNNLFRVTHVSSVNHDNYAVVSASDISPDVIYLTRISVRNSKNVDLSNSNILKIVLSSYGIFSNSFRIQNVHIDFDFLLIPTPYPSTTTPSPTSSPSPTTSLPSPTTSPSHCQQILSVFFLNFSFYEFFRFLIKRKGL
uniref:Uncharacterized protein n=1 Tax=Cacopsylla melanoneura TaxID=428564 RepID=A0A8D8UUP5_9HEMI